MIADPAKATTGSNDQCQPGTARYLPGKLRGEVWLTVQTRIAQGFIFGRAATVDKPSILGLLGFADRLRVIWNAAGTDDPYADWWLIKVDKALEHARDRIYSEQAALAAIMQKQSALQIQVAESEQPYRIALQFANPYAFWGAQLIGEFDGVARTVLTARYVGLLNSTAAHEYLQMCSGPIRTLFAVTQGYRALAINRDSMNGDGKAVRDAVDVMGVLPPSVLSGDRKPSLTPYRAGQATPLAASLTDIKEADRS
ncbi:MAG: TIGR03761 family integrating conjugative element protein [Woeseia sp.]